jgi:IS5 family transposase
MPDRDFYYLVGLRFERNGEHVERSFWADGLDGERAIWENCLRELKAIGNAQIVSYGAYEIRFLRQMKSRYILAPEDVEFVDRLIGTSVNLVGCMYGKIYFPTFSNSLKEVGRYLGWEWNWPQASGAAAPSLRRAWELSADDGIKRELIGYNTDDCRATAKVADALVRIFRGNARSQGKLLSLFEPSTEVIRKGKAGKPNEFGKVVKLQEAENQIITDYEVYARRPYDSDLLVAAIETHQALLGRAPRLVAADAAFYSAKNEAAAKAKGVKRVCIPNRSTESLERKREQRKRWFRGGQKWRTGCEGRISVVKRRHGLDRCRYKGFVGMNRWVGLAVIADNVVNIGRARLKGRPVFPWPFTPAGFCITGRN